jgi:hypothetical protein
VTHPDDEVLAALALGDPAPSGVAGHVRDCPSCSEALASMRDTITTLRAPVPGLVAPPAAVWESVEAEIDRTSGRAVPAVVAGAGSAPAVDPREDAAPRGTGGSAASGRRWVTAAWVAGAAAAGIVIGVVGARAVDDDRGGASVTVASTSLDTLDTGQAKGTADIVRQDGRLDLEVSTQPIDPDGGYLEVWLINQDLKRMVSVGVLEPKQTDQTFAIPQELLDQGYTIVDISREGFDDSPAHSGDSVVRGTLPT